MKKLLLNIVEYAFFTLVTFLFLGIAITIASFIWLSDYKEKNLPHHIVQIASKFYSTQLIGIKIDNATIKLNKDLSIKLQSSISINIKNGDTAIAKIEACQVRLYLSKIKNLKIPYNLTIQKANFTIHNTTTEDNAISDLVTKQLLKKTSAPLQITKLSIHDSIIKLNHLEYHLNQDIDLKELPEKIIIPSLGKNTPSINIGWEKQTKNNTQHNNFYIKNIPFNTIATFIPRHYKPPILNDLTTPTTIIITTTLTKQNSINLQITNNEEDKNVKHISITGKQNSKSLFSTAFNIKLKNDLGHFKGTSRILLKKHWVIKYTPKIFVNTEIDNINLKNLKQLWPNEVENQTRNWLVSNITEGKINKAFLKLNIQDLHDTKKDKLDAYLTFNNLTLNYYDEHKPITKSNGNAHFSLERIKINIDHAKVGNADIDNSRVTIDFLAPGIPLTIDVNAKGQMQNFVHLLNGNTENNFQHRGVNIKKTKGLASFQCKVIMPLEHDISIHNSYISAQGKIENANLNVTNNLKVTSPIINLHIQDHTVSVAGKVDINGQNATLTLVNNLISKDHFDTQLAINAIIQPKSELLMPLHDRIAIERGEILGNFVYLSKDNLEKMQLQLNMENSQFVIPDIGLKKASNNDAKFTMEMESVSQGKWVSKNLSLISKADNINIKADIELSNDFNNILFLNADIKIPSSSINFVLNKDDTKESFSVISKSLDLENTNLFEIFNALTKSKQKQSKETSISLQLDHIRMKNGIYFKNIIGHFDCKRSICSNSGLSMSMNHNKNLTVKLLNKSGKNFWLIKSNNAAYFLKGLNIYQNIEGGELTVKLENITSKNSKTPSFSGTFKMTDFSAIKTPLLAKLVILSPFSSLIKTIEGEDLLPFKNMEGQFVIQNQSMQIAQAFATGKFLTATIKGNVNYKNDTLNLHGKMIPKSLVNSMFNEQAEQEKGKAILSTKYRIVGKISEPEVRVNPIGAILSILTRIPLGLL